MTTTNRTAKPKIDVERVRYIVERDEQFDGGEQCMVLLPSGDVVRFSGPAEAKLWIAHEEQRRIRQVSARLLARVAAIEWRDGLQPPAEIK